MRESMSEQGREPREWNKDRVSESSESSEFLQQTERVVRPREEQTSEDAQRITEVRRQIAEYGNQDREGKDHGTKFIVPVRSERVERGGKAYTVNYVVPESIAPFAGIAHYGQGTADVRIDLAPRVQRFVREHELYHLRDKYTWGGRYGSEFRANIIPGLRDPIGLLATIRRGLRRYGGLRGYLQYLRYGSDYVHQKYAKGEWPSSPT